MLQGGFDRCLFATMTSTVCELKFSVKGTTGCSQSTLWAIPFLWSAGTLSLAVELVFINRYLAVAGADIALWVDSLVAFVTASQNPSKHARRQFKEDCQAAFSSFVNSEVPIGNANLCSPCTTPSLLGPYLGYLHLLLP